MGIENIHIFMHPDMNNAPHPETQALAVLQQELAEEHRRGEHPWGKMIRACPLCQAS